MYHRDWSRWSGESGGLPKRDANVRNMLSAVDGRLNIARNQKHTRYDPVKILRLVLGPLQHTVLIVSIVAASGRSLFAAASVALRLLGASARGVFCVVESD
jgi:hypothetical protein